MISLGLRKKQLDEFHELLASPHTVRNSIYILSLEEQYLQSITNRLLEGQVNIDADAEVSRSCTMSLLDPEAQLNFDTESPHSGALYMDRMIYVVQTIAEPFVTRTALPELRNLAPNPSLESSVGAAAGTISGTLYVGTYDTDPKVHGTRSYRTTRAVESPSAIISSVRVTPATYANLTSMHVTAGQVISPAIKARCNINCRGRIQVIWRDTSNAQVGLTENSEYQNMFANNWTRLKFEGLVAPANGLIEIRSLINTNAGNTSGGERVNVDEITITPGPVVGSYGDGDMATWVWDGTPHQSSSTRPAQYDAPEPKSYDIPVFRGPVTKLDRTGDILNLEASGKEVLTKGWMWKSWTYRKGWRKAAIIINMLHHAAGERRMQIKHKSPRIPKWLAVKRDTIPWVFCQRLARDMNKQLFYDARGYAKLRSMPSKSVFTFRSGRGGTVMTQPVGGYDLTALKNVVWAKGRKPKQKTKKDKKDNKNRRKKKRPEYIATAPRSHPLSPWRLGRNGVGLRFVEEIEEDSLRSQSEVRTFAKRRLKQLLLEGVEVSFDALPVPHLEPMDVCRLQTPDFSGTFRLKKMSIPLTADAASSIGYNKRLVPRKARIRRRS